MKLPIFFISLFTFTAFAGWADVDIDQQDIGSEQITAPVPKRQTPFNFGARIDAIGNSKIQKGFFKGDEIKFATAEVEAGMVVYYCPEFTEGLRVDAGYAPTYLRWSENPWFEQDHFNIVSLSLIGFSKRYDRWFWRSQLTVNMDADEWQSDYMSYDILLWGRYAYCENIGVHLGFWGETGLQMDRVYPIIGFDWTISPKWKLSLVYPVNVSLDYSLTKTWSLALAGRFFNSRFRVHHDECTSKALVRYTNIGGEFAIKFDNDELSFNIHAGGTFGGKFRQANKHNHHAHTFDLDSALYAGGEVNVKF